jgi:hypothetical protein
MVMIEKRGKSYRLTVSLGYVGGRQSRAYMTWNPRPHRLGHTSVQVEAAGIPDGRSGETRASDSLAPQILPGVKGLDACRSPLYHKSNKGLPPLVGRFPHNN